MDADGRLQWGVVGVASSSRLGETSDAPHPAVASELRLRSGATPQRDGWPPELLPRLMLCTEIGRETGAN